MAVLTGLDSVSLQPDEILMPGSSISIRTRTAMDPDAARKGLGVRGVDGSVRLSDGGRRATWSAQRGLPPGAHSFVCDPVVSKTGRVLSHGGTIRFFVVETKARVSSSIAVESMVRYRVRALATTRLPLHEKPGGRYIELMKGTQRRSGTPVALAFDQAGRKVDERKVLGSIAKARARKYGKLHPDLYDELRRRGSRAVDVAIWTHFDPKIFDAERPTRGAAARPPRSVAAQRRAIDQATERCVPLLHEVGASRIQREPDMPVVYARVDAPSIRRLTRHEEIAAVFLHDTKGIDDLKDSIAIANSDDVHALGKKGKGVKVAVWENGPDSTTNLVIEDRFTSSPTLSDHSRHVHGIIKNKQKNKPKGHAPSCLLHSANKKDLSALRWAVRDKGCTVVNQSFHRSSEPKSGELSYDDIYKDWLALTWPYPTILQAAGNYWSTDPDNVDPPSSEFVNHKGYNSLAVANHNDDASAMSGSSVFRNPSSPYGDRELPEISANGTGVQTVGLTKSGTSMASPAVAGVAALLQSTATTLKHWPEGCRAILLAGATRNVVNDTWWQDVQADNDASDGTGAVNALESHRIAGSRRARNAAATRRGWDVGSLRSADFDSKRLSKFSYKVSVPKGIHGFGPTKVKVALAWTSKVTDLSIFGFTIPLSSQLTVDLDLKIFDSQGAQVGYSGSWDNSYEIAEFVGEPGETYTIKIRRWSGSDRVWYGISWAVIGGLFDFLRLARASERLGSRNTARVAALLR